MESDNEQNEIKKRNLLPEFFDYLDDNNDCLTDAFITIYESSLWCIKLFLKPLWQILLLTKEELKSDQNATISSRDILSMNNSAGENYSEKIYRKLPRHHSSNRRLPKSNAQHTRQKTSSKLSMLSNKTRVIIRSTSNQNINHASLTKDKPSSNTLGTLNSHITVAPVDSLHCRQMTSRNNQLPNHSDSKQMENINLREQLTDALCRRSYEPLTFINRGMCCGHCRPFFFPNVSFHHLPSAAPQQEKELSQKSEHSPQIDDTTDTQSTEYSVSLNEPLSTDTIMSNHETTNEQNHSILSFPEHDTPPSQDSEKSLDDDDQIKLNAQILVHDSIQNARDKYQKILQMNIDQDRQNKMRNDSQIKLSNSDLYDRPSVKQVIEKQSKQPSVSIKSKIEKPSNNHALCQELCKKLNLSDSTQVAEVVRILASNAPHILKQQLPTNTPSINKSIINKENDNTLCSQLLLHPPFNPKRLIHLCVDGSIQVLSTTDNNSTARPINNQQQYELNYSNSALIPTIQHTHHPAITESTSTQQSQSTNEVLLDQRIMDDNSILSLQQKRTLLKYRSPITTREDFESDQNHSETIFEDNDPIVKIDLALDDETIEDDQNSLPEIFFKRIIASE